jgi:very-short-patch-repair endonuclease
MPRHYTSRIELICEICGKSIMLPPSVVAQGRKHCSAKCMGVAKDKGASFKCAGCGKEVKASPSQAAHKKYCSMRCLKAHKEHTIVCQVCGNERVVTLQQLKQGARFCSWECARKVLNAPRPMVICEQCGKECAVPPSRVRQGMRFCSHSCRSIYNIVNGAMKSPTSIERTLYKVLDYLGISYIKQYPIREAGTVVDAYVPSRCLVLYADGDYWHILPKTKARDKLQNDRLAELGFTVHRLREQDLRHNPVATVQSTLQP